LKSLEQAQPLNRIGDPSEIASVVAFLNYALSKDWLPATFSLERSRGLITWGKLRVFSSGIEVVYDHPFVDSRGRKKTSYLIYQQEVEQQALSILRYHDELTPDAQTRLLDNVWPTLKPLLGTPR